MVLGLVNVIIEVCLVLVWFLGLVPVGWLVLGAVWVVFLGFRFGWFCPFSKVVGGGGGVAGGFGASSNLACLSLTTSLGFVLLGPGSSLSWVWFWVGVGVGVGLIGLVSWVGLVWSVVGVGWCFVRVFPWLVG